MSHAIRFHRWALAILITFCSAFAVAQTYPAKPIRIIVPFAWVKVCGPERVSTAGKPFHDAIPFARTVMERFPDRVLWGTDCRIRT